MEESYEKKFRAVKSEVAKAVVGYEDTVDDFLVCLMTGGHLLLEGVPGIAKTTLIKVFTKVIGLDYRRIQFTQDMLPADITGYFYFNKKKESFELRKGPVFTNILMADEINRSSPKTQSALIEVMQENQVTIEGSTIPLDDPFLVVATRNPIETEGVYPLPEAQLDRFMIKSEMGYLSDEEELNMLKMKDNDGVSEVRTLGGDFGAKIHGLHRRVSAAPVILEYIRDLAIETRKAKELALGASPRAAEQLLYASKAYAVIQGRSYVIPDDVKTMARKVIPHRLILTIDSELENINKFEVLENILEDEVEAPKGSFTTPTGSV